MGCWSWIAWKERRGFVADSLDEHSVFCSVQKNQHAASQGIMLFPNSWGHTNLRLGLGNGTLIDRFSSPFPFILCPVSRVLISKDFAMKRSLVVFVIATLVVCPAHAAVITWGAAQSTTSSAANDVVSGGDVVLAINGQSQLNSSSLRPGPVTLGDVLFDSPDFNQFLGRSSIDDPSALSLPAGTTTGDSDYDLFLNHVAFVNASNATNTANTGLSGMDDNAVYPIAGLTQNTDYLIQLWYTDERTNLSPRIAIFGDNETLPSSVEVPGRGANGLGSFVVGQFTADATTQDLRIGINGASRAHVTGLLVRAVAVPEPSTFSVLALAIVVVGLRRRHSR